MAYCPELTPVLVLTDLLRDVDDATAITYLAGCENINIAGMVTTHMIPHKRAMAARRLLYSLGLYDVPIGEGSVYPLGQEDTLLAPYMKDHTIDGMPYEGRGVMDDERYPDAVEVIHGAINRYGIDRRRSALKILAIAPMTDLARAMEHNVDNICRISGLYIQGQARVKKGRLVPDPAAYNIRIDLEAPHRVFELQDHVPITVVSRHAARKAPLTRGDFDLFASTQTQAGIYLRQHALDSITCYARRSPRGFENSYGISADRLHELDTLSNPYDPLAAKALANQIGLIPKMAGSHALIGASAKEPGIASGAELRVRYDIVDTILDALFRMMPKEAPMSFCAG